MDKILTLKILLRNNKIIIENYFFMTLLKVLNSLFYLLIYPYLIRTLGADTYGLYVFAMSIVTYFITLISFGFNFPAVKSIAQNSHNNDVKSDTLSCVFTAKMYLEILSFIFFGLLIISIGTLRQHWLLYLILFGNTIVNIIFPTWYFQGIQKMRIVTCIQFIFKLISLPFIFYFVNDADDLVKFAIIITAFNVSGGFVAAYMIHCTEKVKIRWVPISKLKIWYKDAVPFFWSTAGATIKHQSVSIIIGSYFNMADVALYDLAYKIIQGFHIMFGSINGALFPKIVNDNRKEVIKKVLFYELIAGFVVIAAVCVLGKWFVLFLGGYEMIAAYPIASVLSVGVLTFLLVGGYIDFIFVPQNKYYFVTKNQIISFSIFFTLTFLGLFIWKNILLIAIAWSMAGLFEILYCNIIIRKYKLF